MNEQRPNKADNSFILDELRTGNERAFEFIFREYYQTLCQFAYSITKDQPVSESVAQDVLVKLWEMRGSIGNISNLLAYLMTMVRNQCVDFLRKERSSSKLYAKLKFEETGNTTEDQLSASEFEENLLKSMRNLPDRCRIAMEMSRFEGLSNKEIAQKMQISVKGVEALIGRSLKLLRIDLVDFLPSAATARNSYKATVLIAIISSKLRSLKFGRGMR